MGRKMRFLLGVMFALRLVEIVAEGTTPNSTQMAGGSNETGQIVGNTVTDKLETREHEREPSLMRHTGVLILCYLCVFGIFLGVSARFFWFLTTVQARDSENPGYVDWGQRINADWPFFKYARWGRYYGYIFSDSPPIYSLPAREDKTAPQIVPAETRAPRD